MFYLSKIFRFEASHQLKHHDGKCANLHGHSWVVVIHLKRRTLEAKGPKENMVFDFGDLSAAMKPLIEKLDHQHLNDILGTDMPTSEILAVWIHQHIATIIPEVYAVELSETCTSGCKYEPDQE